jgi:hypothetical protein
MRRTGLVGWFPVRRENRFIGVFYQRSLDGSWRKRANTIGLACFWHTMEVLAAGSDSGIGSRPLTVRQSY